jgi:hypothetical protein
MPSPDCPQDHPGDAARTTRDLPDKAAADHTLLSWLAAGYLLAFLEGQGTNPTPNTLAALRQTFLDGSSMCYAAATRATAPSTMHVIDVLNHQVDAERVYVLADGVTPADLAAALTTIAAEIGIFTFSPDAIDNLNDHLSCLYTVCDELAGRVQDHARHLTEDEWAGLNSFFQHGLKLVAVHEATASTDTKNSEGGDEPTGDAARIEPTPLEPDA